MQNAAYWSARKSKTRARPSRRAHVMSGALDIKGLTAIASLRFCGFGRNSKRGVFRDPRANCLSVTGEPCRARQVCRCEPLWTPPNVSQGSGPRSGVPLSRPGRGSYIRRSHTVKGPGTAGPGAGGPLLSQGAAILIQNDPGGAKPPHLPRIDLRPLPSSSSAMSSGSASWCRSGIDPL